MATVIEITLNRLHIDENGDIRRKEASNALGMSLIYPTCGKPVVSTVKELKLIDNETVDFRGTNPNTGTQYTWADRIVLKERIEDSTQLVVQLTDVEKTPKLDRFLAGLFKNVFKAVWGLVTGGVSNILLGAVSDSLAAAHLDSFEVKGETLKIIGRAESHIEESSLPAVGETKDIEMALVVPKRIEMDVAVFDEKTHKPKHTKKLVLNRGTTNGRLVLTLKNLGRA